MRLVCPNCGAQYDVPVEVIPEAGRDVQCSNCGHTWFQKRVAPSPEAHSAPAPTPEPIAIPEPPDPDLPAPKKSIDPEMAELFREEREFEARQRASEGLETQPDLGLEPPAEDERTRRTRESRERMAQLKGEEIAQGSDRPVPAPAPADAELQAAAVAAAAASRRELLPDVDEINQTLRASSEPRVIDREAGTPSRGVPRQTGNPFARGFMLVVLLAVIGVALYVSAPKLSQQVPQAAPYLDTYVATVDKGRVWLDVQVKALLSQLDQFSSEAAAPDPVAPDSTN
ncbi:MJ0042 family finger-like domain-containing protein [Antarctobacter heliothermus]|uniref:MJ0042 family finger-like domain-containing protein n=2 Tax=Antarctobacter heliothermus TaxID=74033 RepID=A0A239HKN4_9RHOB|nr:MJ0042 family finger-like domain-containing protein [Antarctobacter heliothermus]